MFALSVSISTSSSPRLTSFPSAFSHLRIVPSSMESDRRGIETSAMGGGYSRNWRTGSGALVRRGRNREAEDAAAALARGEADLAALALDDLAADRQPDARALERLAIVQP